MAEPIIVALPDGTEAEFPAGTPNATIEAVLRKQFPPPTPQITATRGDTPIPKSFGTRMEENVPLAIPAVKAAQFVGNIPGDAVNVAKGAYNVLRHPIDSLATVARLGAGTVEKGVLAPLRAMGVTDYKGASEQYPEAVLAGVYDAVKSPADIPRKFVNTVAEHPVATMLAAGGAGNTQYAKEGALRVKTLAQSQADRSAKWLYKSALKPAPSINRDVVNRSVETALREGMLPTGTQTQETIANFTQRMDRAAEAAMKVKEAAGEMVSLKPARDSVSALRAHYAKNSLTPQKDLGALKAIEREIEAWPEQVTPTQALKYRRDLNSKLAPLFERAKRSGGLNPTETIMQEGLGQIRKAVNGEIHRLVPELKTLGIRESELLDFARMSLRRMGHEEGWDIFSLSSLVAGNIGGSIAGATGTTLAWNALRYPNAKGWIAVKLAKAGKLSTASPSTLELLNMTRESAIKAQPILKALPAAPVRMGSGKADPSGIIKGGQETVSASADAYEDAWRAFANVEGERAALRAQDTIPRPVPSAAENYGEVISNVPGRTIPQPTSVGALGDASEAWGGFPRRLEQGYVMPRVPATSNPKIRAKSGALSEVYR